MSKSDYEDKELSKLVGCEVTHLVETPEGEDEHFYGLRFFNPKTKKVYIAWIQCDPEGNGPGFLNIDDETR